MKKIYLLCSLMLLVGWAQAQVRLEKDYQESFAVKKGQKVEVSNKYGEVIIQVWDQNSVKVQAQVTAEGKNQDQVSKSMDRVQVAMRKVGQLVTIKTEIDSPGGNFGGLLGDVKDYGRKLFGKQKLQIDYEIWIPRHIDLSIVNRYGNVYLASVEGSVDITLAHGDLRANRVAGRLDMEHSFGKSHFDYVKQARLTLKGAKATIEEGSFFDVRSSSSEVHLSNISTLKLDSRNDEIKVFDVNEITGHGHFTTLEAEEVNKKVKVDFSFGEIWISKIEKRFKNIDLKGKSTDINLVLNQASYINADITGDEQKMVVPNSMMSLTRNYNEETGRVNLRGMVGYSNDYKSVLTIDADGGDVVISIKDTPVFSDRR